MNMTLLRDNLRERVALPPNVITPISGRFIMLRKTGEMVCFLPPGRTHEAAEDISLHVWHYRGHTLWMQERHIKQVRYQQRYLTTAPMRWTHESTDDTRVASSLTGFGVITTRQLVISDDKGSLGRIFRSEDHPIPAGARVVWANTFRTRE